MRTANFSTSILSPISKRVLARHSGSGKTTHAPSVACLLLIAVLGLIGIAHANAASRPEGSVEAPPAPHPPANPAPRPKFSTEVPLALHQPAVFQLPEFQTWKLSNPITGWRETACINDRQRVVIRGQDDSHLFAVELTNCSHATPSVLHAAAIDVSDIRDSRSHALEAFRALPGSLGRSTPRYVQPDVRFNSNGTAILHWQIVVASNNKLIKIDFVRGKESSIESHDIPHFGPPPPLPRADHVEVSGADDLAQNELHHPDQFRETAENATMKLETTLEKARGIFDLMHTENYVYNSFVDKVTDFTLADVLTRDVNERQGICDELAVVQTTFLRSLGIPAHLVFLKWTESGKDVAHAVVEFQDENGKWHTTDSLGEFDDPSAYGTIHGVGDITVMDATEPDDSRSDADVNKIADPRGDEMFSTWGDFRLDPAYPGEWREAYSVESTTIQDGPQ